MTGRYRVETIDNAWSYINGPNGYRSGPIRYRWEAEEWAEEMNSGKPERIGRGENSPDRQNEKTPTP